MTSSNVASATTSYYSSSSEPSESGSESGSEVDSDSNSGNDNDDGVGVYHEVYDSGDDDNDDDDDDNDDDDDDVAIKVVPSFLGSFLEETSRSAGGITGGSSDAIYNLQASYSEEGHYHVHDNSMKHMESIENVENRSTNINNRRSYGKADTTSIAADTNASYTTSGTGMTNTNATGARSGMYTSILHVSNRNIHFQNSNGKSKGNGELGGTENDKVGKNNEEKRAFDKEMKVIEHYLEHHHATRELNMREMREMSSSSSSLKNSNVNINVSYNHNESASVKSETKNSANSNEKPKPSRTLEDHRLYYYTNSASATAIRRTFLYCIQTDDINLAETLLRDVGIDYLLRHCVLYNNGILDEQIDLIDGYNSVGGSPSKNKVNNLTASTTAATTTSKSTSNKNTKKRPGLKGKLKSHRREGPANIFWLTALHGSANVLELIIEATWIHFAEISFQFLNQVDVNIGGGVSGVFSDNSNGTLDRINDGDGSVGESHIHNQDRNDDTGEGGRNNAEQEDEEEVLNSDYSVAIIDYRKMRLEEKTKKEISKILNESAYGTTPLYAAAAKNHSHVISILLRYGADPNKPNTGEWGMTAATPAIIAASRNHTASLQALAENGETDFNKESTERKITPLLAACRSGCIEAVRFLTQLTKKVNAEGKEKESGDHSGDSYARAVECACQDSMGYGCASIAAQYNQHDVIIYLSQIHDPDNAGIDINQRNSDGLDSVIHVATRYNRCTVVRALLEMIPRTCNIMALNSQRKTALHIATNQGFTQVVKEFVRHLPLEIMAKFDVEDIFGLTPIFYGCLNGYDDIVNILAPISDIDTQRKVQLVIKKKNETPQRGGKYDMNEEKKKKQKKKFTMQSPLHAASCHGFVNIVYTLLHCGADIDQTDGEGHTALALASKMGHLEVVKILCEMGADVKMKTKRGKTPLAKAKKYRRSHVIEYLDQHGAK